MPVNVQVLTRRIKKQGLDLIPIYLNEYQQMKYRNRFYMSSFVSLFFIYTQSIAAELATAGWIEEAVIFPQGIHFHAKLDTGAETSSINAINTEFFERDNRRWARFTLSNRDNKSVTIEAKVIREASIKRHYEKSQVRPVIMLDICIGDVRKTEEVNLVDRSKLQYQLLIGRNFLRGDLAIDSGSTYLLSPDCPD